MAFAWIGIASAVTGGVVLLATGLPATEVVPFAVVSAAIHIAYNLALMNSYRLGAFNQTYPIARGTSPLVVAVGAYFLAGEHLSIVALAGIATLAAGLMSLALSAGRLTRGDLPAVGAAVLTGLTIAGYTLVDGLGVRRAGDPWAYTALLFVGGACGDPRAGRVGVPASATTRCAPVSSSGEPWQPRSCRSQLCRFR
jgi:drug/metabolite transporter (DMT)-like permease